MFARPTLHSPFGSRTSFALVDFLAIDGQLGPLLTVRCEHVLAHRDLVNVSANECLADAIERALEEELPSYHLPDRAMSKVFYHPSLAFHCKCVSGAFRQGLERRLEAEIFMYKIRMILLCLRSAGVCLL